MSSSSGTNDGSKPSQQHPVGKAPSKSRSASASDDSVQPAYNARHGPADDESYSSSGEEPAYFKDSPLSLSEQLANFMAHPHALLDKAELTNDVMTVNWQHLVTHFLNWGLLSFEAAVHLIDGAIAVLQGKPNVLRLSGDVTVLGDVHGQLFDLVLAVMLGGDPANRTYLFLGDYVDRGVFSTEIMFLLCALVICRPDSVLLLRGNHECREISETHGFKHECSTKYPDYGDLLFERFVKLFSELPIAAVYEASDGARVFCCHGGIANSLMDISVIDKIDRRVEDFALDSPICDLLWADPLEPVDVIESETAWPMQSQIFNRDRGVSVKFGPSLLERFLVQNNFACLLRAHQVQPRGFNEHPEFVRRAASIWPMVMTVFTAPNYNQSTDNAAAVLELLADPQPDGRFFRYHVFQSERLHASAQSLVEGRASLAARVCSTPSGSSVASGGAFPSSAQPSPANSPAIPGSTVAMSPDAAAAALVAAAAVRVVTEPDPRLGLAAISSPATPIEPLVKLSPRQRGESVDSTASVPGDSFHPTVSGVARVLLTGHHSAVRARKTLTSVEAVESSGALLRDAVFGRATIANAEMRPGDPALAGMADDNFYARRRRDSRREAPRAGRATFTDLSPLSTSFSGTASAASPSVALSSVPASKAATLPNLPVVAANSNAGAATAAPAARSVVGALLGAKR